MDGYKKKDDFDDIEFIDATDGDVIEIVDPYESEVIEIPIEKENIVKKKPSHVAQAPSKKIMDSDFDMFNPSTTVILKKAPAEEKEEKKEEKAEVKETPKPAATPKEPVSKAPTAPIKDMPQDVVKPIDISKKPVEEEKKPEAKPYVAKVPTGKIQDVNFDDLDGYDYRSNIKKAEPKPAEPKAEKKETVRPASGSSAVNTSLAGSKPKTSSSAANPLFASDDDYTTPTKKEFSILGHEITPKMIAIGAGALIALILLIVIFSSGNSCEINLKKFTTVKYEGFEGTAKPVVIIDYDGIVAEYSKKIKISSSDSFADILKRDIDYTLSKTEGLTSGEIVYLNWVVNNDDFEKVTNGTLKGGEMSVKVGNLPVLTNDYDPFDGMQYTVTGYSGEGVVEITKPESALAELQYIPSDNNTLYNGQEIKITLAVEGQDDVDAYLRSKGLGAVALEKTVSVSGLKEYEIYDLFKNVNVTFSGYDGIGTAVVAGDSGYSDIKFKLDKDSMLSMGDKVVVKAYTESGKKVREVLLADKLSIKFDELEVTVSDLVAPEEYDPFSELELKYTGIAPDGILSIDPSGVQVAELIFTASKMGGLNNGDEITITISCSDSKDPKVVCLEKGLKITDVSKVYTVEKLSQYIVSLDQLNDAANGMLDATTKHIMKDVIAGQINEDSIASITLDSCYLQYPKSDDVQLAYNLSFGGDIHNRLYMVYKVSIKDGAYEFDYLWPVMYCNLLINSENALVVDTNNYGAALRSFTAGGKSYFGYQQINDFVTEFIDTDANTYSYEKKNMN